MTVYEIYTVSKAVAIIMTQSKADEYVVIRRSDELPPTVLYKGDSYQQAQRAIIKDAGLQVTSHTLTDSLLIEMLKARS